MLNNKLEKEGKRRRKMIIEIMAYNRMVGNNNKK